MQKLILLVDDDPDEYYILNQAFQLAGIPSYCMWANDAERAQTLLQQVLPDFIFIDYNMPRINGITCLEQIRQIPNLDKVPVIMYSNYISDETVSKALASGASCMQKTGSLLQLVQHLIRIMGEGKLLHSL